MRTSAPGRRRATANPDAAVAVLIETHGTIGVGDVCQLTILVLI